MRDARNKRPTMRLTRRVNKESTPSISVITIERVTSASNIALINSAATTRSSTHSFSLSGGRAMFVHIVVVCGKRSSV